MEIEDTREFLSRLESADAECMAAVLARFHPSLIALARRSFPRSLRGRCGPEDVVQETLWSFTLRLREGGYRVDCLDGVRHLLKTILCDKLRCAWWKHSAECRDVGRESSLRDATGLDRTAVQMTEPHADPLELPIAHDELDQLLAQFPAVDQEIIRRHLEHYTIAECAQLAGCSKRHVDQVLAKVRRLAEMRN